MTNKSSNISSFGDPIYIANRLEYTPGIKWGPHIDSTQYTTTINGNLISGNGNEWIKTHYNQPISNVDGIVGRNTMKRSKDVGDALAELINVL